MSEDECDLGATSLWLLGCIQEATKYESQEAARQGRDKREQII